MGITKRTPDKFKQLVSKQPAPQRPPTLGEPCDTTDWDLHIAAGHKIKHFVRIQDMPGKQKEALVNTPENNHYYIAAKEEFCGYYYIWILCMINGSNRIKWRINSGDMQFVLWDVPEAAVKAEEPIQK